MVTDKMVEAARKAMLENLSDYVLTHEAMRAALLAADAEADPDPRDATIARLRAEVERLRAAQVTALYHPDDYAVQAFTNAMIEKMALSRAKGRGGWEACTWLELWGMLREHVEKGDPVDVANLAMMIWHNARAARADKTT